MKASTATAGDWSPTARTTNTRVAAMLYAGATDAVAITVLEIRPRAPDLRPLFERLFLGLYGLLGGGHTSSFLR